MKRWLLFGSGLALVTIVALALVTPRLAFPTAAATIPTAPQGTDSGAQDQPQEQKPWVGLFLVTLNERIKERWDLKVDEGVVVARVVKDSPAAKAGLKEKDVITAIAGIAVEKVKDVQDKVQSAKIGDVLAFTVQRGDQQLAPSVTLEARPERPKADVGPRFFRGFMPGWGRLGAQHTLQVSRGTVTAFGNNQLTIKLEGTDRTVTYQVTDKTVIQAGDGKKQLSDLKTDDKVLVVSVDGGQEAKGIVKTDALSRKAPFWRGHGFALPFGPWGGMPPLSPFGLGRTS